MAIKDSIYYIHTTATIVDYVEELSQRYLPNISSLHLVDETILTEIRKGRMATAQQKLEKIVSRATASGAKKIMITCTSTGQLVDGMQGEAKAMLYSIEQPAAEAVKLSGKTTGVVYTNPTVWPEIEHILLSSGVDASTFSPCYVENAFDAILNNDISTHDKLVVGAVKQFAEEYDQLLLAQVSICSAKERISDWDDMTNIVSLAEMGVKSLAA